MTGSAAGGLDADGSPIARKKQWFRYSPARLVEPRKVDMGFAERKNRAVFA